MFFIICLILFENLFASSQVKELRIIRRISETSGLGKGNVSSINEGLINYMLTNEYYKETSYMVR